MADQKGSSRINDKDNFATTLDRTKEDSLNSRQSYNSSVALLPDEEVFDNEVNESELKQDESDVELAVAISDERANSPQPTPTHPAFSSSPELVVHESPILVSFTPKVLTVENSNKFISQKVIEEESGKSL